MVKTESKKHHPIRRAKKAPGEVETVARRESGKSARASQATPEAEAALADIPRRERRALSHVGGEVHFQGGTEEERAALLHALDVSADETQVMKDVHGFHSYPARLHPLTAQRLIEGFSKTGDVVLDPFCGSGTVVVEARALGRQALGSDLNPLAVELSWIKSRGPTAHLVGDLVRAAGDIAEVAEERRLAKADPYRRYDEDTRERYPIHILLELDSLAHGISLVPGNEVKRMLRLVISSILTKVSHSEGDTTRRKSPRRLPSGFAIKVFAEKTKELAERLNAYRARLPQKAPRAYVTMADARELESVESDSIDLIVTSPPYPGVYNYLDHHMHRIEWLGLHPGRLANAEIGARRNYRRLGVDEAAQEWRSEIGPTLYELRRALSNHGRGIIVVADSVVDRQPLRADEQIRMVAARAGIDITCIASQERPLFLYGAEEAFGDSPRMEHVVVFRPGLRPQRQDKPQRSNKPQRSSQPLMRNETERRGENSERQGPPRGDARSAARGDARSAARGDARGESRSWNAPRPSGERRFKTPERRFRKD